jgi:hypothetical protein
LTVGDQCLSHLDPSDSEGFDRHVDERTEIVAAAHRDDDDLLDPLSAEGFDQCPDLLPSVRWVREVDAGNEAEPAARTIQAACQQRLGRTKPEPDRQQGDQVLPATGSDDDIGL